MKTLLCSVIILGFVILSTVSVAIRANSLLNNFSEYVEENVFTDTSSLEIISEEYEKLKRFMTLFIREDDIRETEMYLQDIISAAETNDSEALMTAKSRLMLHIEQLRRLSVFSFEAIF